MLVWANLKWILCKEENNQRNWSIIMNYFWSTKRAHCILMLWNVFYSLNRSTTHLFINMRLRDIIISNLILFIYFIKWSQTSANYMHYTFKEMHIKKNYIKKTTNWFLKQSHVHFPKMKHTTRFWIRYDDVDACNSDDD